MDGNPQMLGHRYRLLTQVGKGGMGRVYRALDCLTGQHVALKQVSRSPEPDGSSHSSTVYYALAEEFKVLASLRHPHIISVLDYGFDHNRDPYFTLEMLEQAQSFVAYAEDRPLDQQIALVIQMLQALTYLHQRGIIHRDLKPSNVLVINHQVKVLDFGLAVARQYLGPGSERVGTLFYMAPETFAGAPVSMASDLYAVGVMLYQMLTGQLPFSSEGSKYALMYKIARATPDYTSLEVHPLHPIIERLLQKDPAHRYESAEELITALCDAVDYPTPAESIAVRESFLQAAQFVGRERELDLLREALRQSYNGQGSAWLIGGESGVGKSRLLEELRTQALVDGAIVLRGQTIAEGGLPYQMWREAIRRLILQTPLTDFNAAVLKPLVLDISALLGRSIPDSPLIDAESLQLRLLAVIENLFRQQQQPIFLLLEDLQWADDSLLLLKRLHELARTSSLMIIGTYRDDERPSLPDELPMLNHIKLERLSADSIEALSMSMLGEVGKSKAVIDLLKRETEGNVFFIVEVVRTLAEEAGQRSDIGRKTLPEHVFAGGVQAIVERRLARVPESSRRLMTIAAVAGRDLDLKVLHNIMPSLNMQVWLQQVGTVIEVLVGDRYRFAHDKLREGVLRSLTQSDRQQIHQDIACVIERVYPDSPEQFAALAYHWDQARDAAKTIRYAVLAGQQTLRSGNYREAIQFFHQALGWTDQAGSNKQLLGQLHYLIGDANWGQSDMLHSREAHMNALETFGFSVPHGRRQLLLHALKPIFGHLWRSVFGIRRQASNYEELLIVARSYFQILQTSYHDGNFTLGFYCIFSGIDASERAGDDPEAIRLQARNYFCLGFAMGDMGRHRIADFYIGRAEQRVKGYADLQTRAWLDFAYGIYLAGRGQWERVNSLLDKSVRLSAEAGSVRLWGEASEFKVYILSLQNRFAEALASLEGAAQVAMRDEHQAVGRTQVVKASLLFYQGKTEEARNHYFAHEATIKTSLTIGDQTISKFFVSGFLVDLAIRDEDWEEAITLTEALNAQVRGAQTVSFLLARSASVPMLLYLTLWENENKETYRSSAQTAIALFHRKYTRFYEIGQPIELMYRCWYSWLNKQEKQARAIGKQAIHAAQTYNMPYYEATTHYHMARFMPQDDPERANHLELALQLFNHVGAAYDADRVRQQLLLDRLETVD